MSHSFRDAESPKNVRICELTGRMDAAATIPFKKELNAMLDDVSFKLVLLMNGVELISASFLDALLYYAQSVREHRGDVLLVGANPNFRRLMALVGYERYFKFYETEQEALDAFAGSK